MNDFICKPYDGQSLSRCILRHIPAQQLADAAQTPLPLLDPPPPDAPWLDIEGIDTGEAKNHWCGDGRLFASMLKRLFEEFPDVDMPADTADPLLVAAYSRRIHKLRGGACLLGAKTIYSLAGKLEEACSGGSLAQAALYSHQLNGELTRVSESARIAWQTAPAAVGREVSSATHLSVASH